MSTPLTIRSVAYILLSLGWSCQMYGQETLIIGSVDGGTTATISGLILDKESRTTLLGANVFVQETGQGTATEADGRYKLTLDVGTYTFRVSFIGYDTRIIRLDLRGPGELHIELEAHSDHLKEIVITSDDPRQNIEATRMGVSRLSVEAIEALPPFVGETDILKSIVLLPGVSSVGEASAGVNVRGGGTDENLILLGGAPIYNPSHLFGFLSAFNSDMISNVTVYKGGIPSRYGGRASSIIDLGYKKGDKSKWGGTASIGTISSKMSVGGPIIKDKLSILLGGRGSYTNWLLKSTDDPDLQNSSAQFYDFNILSSYQPNDRLSIDIGVYGSKDDFNLLGDNQFAWDNRIGTLDMSYSFSEDLFLRLNAGVSLYNFDVSDESSFNNFKYQSDIDDRSMSLHLDYHHSEKHSFSGGLGGKLYKINPGEIAPISGDSDVNPKELLAEQAREVHAYVMHDFNLGPVAFSYGARYSQFDNMGPGIVNSYFPSDRETWRM